MIKLIFNINRETFVIRIQDKRVFYKDRRFHEEIQILPKDQNMIRKIICSRNKVPMFVLQWINEANSGKNLEEYQTAKDDEALVPIVKKDAARASKGCMFIKRMDEEDQEEEIEKKISKEEVEKLIDKNAHSS